MLSAVISVSGISQAQLENPGFEAGWENGADIAGAEDEPLQWSSLKSADAYTLVAPIVAFKETVNPHSGTYCIRLLNVDTGLGPVANGLLTNGRVHAELVAANGYVFTNTSDTKWNTVFTDRPDSLVGWYRYDPTTGDQGKVEVITHTTAALGKLPGANYPETHWISRARYDITTSSPSTWVRFSVPFTYYSTNASEYILVVLSAGDSTNALIGSEMWIDDLELIYNPNLVNVTPPATQNIDMGVNGTMLTVNYTPNAAVVSAITQEWKYSTTSGSGYTSFGTAETGLTYTPNFATPGIYYVVCDVDFGTEVITSNEVEIVVTDPGANTVTISPSATQNLLVGQNGTLLTATETPSAASSREWKFSTVSGSGYTSFGTAETGLTYTPNFGALGTYYIICESDFSGDVQISNEVTIMVPSAAGINEENLQFNIFNNGSDVNVLMSDIQSNTLFSVFSLDGKLIYSDQLTETNSVHHIPATGVFVYRVVRGDRIITGKINL
ncbi:MAG: PCMD domain-containing protein [Crocinitomicaceae bacterium]|nr:PCMD domain-containing protein [Crocinitomicaceae bacterium]